MTWKISWSGMSIYGKHLSFHPPFFGREKETEWLFNRAGRRGRPIVICGSAGIGKTALLRHFLASVRTPSPPLVWTLSADPNEAVPHKGMAELSARIDALPRDRNPAEIIAIDDAEGLSDREMSSVARRIFNIKRIETLIFVTRRTPGIFADETLELGLLPRSTSEDILRGLLGADFPQDRLTLAAMSARLPITATMLGLLLQGRTPDEVNRLMHGRIYDLEEGLLVPRKELIKEVRPRIILTNQSLMSQLQRQPRSVFDLPPRRFEELIAELLSDLGYEVELTPATRDGGKDILAYMTAPHGRVLCLVEAKRYRHDRPVGVELVRQLYGTLVDADASCAMMVTTSSFSPDARSFQQKHQYKLTLRDYGHVVQWIQGYQFPEHDT
jgi:restriction system protein